MEQGSILSREELEKIFLTHTVQMEQIPIVFWSYSC